MEKATAAPKKTRKKKDPAAPAKPRTKKALTPTKVARMDGHASQIAGVRKTALMRLAESHGDTGLMNPRSIDPILYMLADMAETAFGPSVVENCRGAIALSNAGFPKKKALGILTDQICRVHLPTLLASKPDAVDKLKRLPVLNDASYVDYFMTMTMLENATFRTRAQPIMNDLIKMVTGYESEQPTQVCTAVVGFFKETQDQAGFEKLLTSLGTLMKRGR